MSAIVFASEVADVDGLLDRLTTFPLVFAGMPIVAAIIGYVTKLAALRMMFVPIEPVGIGPLKWQGILPKRAARMASTIVDTMTRDLIDARDIIGRLDLQRMLTQVEGPLLTSLESIARDVLDEVQPGLWESLPARARSSILTRLQEEAPVVLDRMVTELGENIDDVFDLKHMVVSNLIRDKALLNEIFHRIGKREFRFIANSGIPFGAAIGLVQAAVYLVFPNPIVLPAFGLFVGYSTDWLALRLLFRPMEPRRILGVTVQGVFMKRQAEVTADYAALMSQEILTPRNFLDALLRGPYSDSLMQLVQRQVKEAVDEQTGRARPLVMLAVGSARYEAIKDRLAQRLVEELPTTMEHALAQTPEALDVNSIITEKMSAMSKPQFEGLLRPVFQADEWILVTVGALLGFVGGLLQDLFLVDFFAHLGR